MPGALARRKCPELIFVKPRFERYREISLQIREIFYAYTDLVEPLSLDEAFLDVTENKVNNPSATRIAKEIRDKIKEKVGLNSSAGISYNKFLAKIASDINKPNGQAVIPPEKATDFLEKLPIEKFFGIGKVTAEKMKKFGIHKPINRAVQGISVSSLGRTMCSLPPDPFGPFRATASPSTPSFNSIKRSHGPACSRSETVAAEFSTFVGNSSSPVRDESSPNASHMTIAPPNINEIPQIRSVHAQAFKPPMNT